MKTIIATLAILAVTVSAYDGRSDYDRAVESAVLIRTGEDGIGSGVYITPTTILTGAHVVANETDIRAYSPIHDNGIVQDPDRYTGGLRATLLRACPEKDLALLRVDGKGKPMRLGKSPQPSDPVFAIGNGEAAFRHMEGHVRSVGHGEAEFPGLVVRARMASHSMPVNFGDSGSALIDGRGEICGINSHIDFGQVAVSRAIDVSEIRAFLKGVE